MLPNCWHQSGQHVAPLSKNVKIALSMCLFVGSLIGSATPWQVCIDCSLRTGRGAMREYSAPPARSFLQGSRQGCLTCLNGIARLTLVKVKNDHLSSRFNMALAAALPVTPRRLETLAETSRGIPVRGFPRKCDTSLHAQASSSQLRSSMRKMKQGKATSREGRPENNTRRFAATFPG